MAWKYSVGEMDGETSKIKNEFFKKMHFLWLITKAMMEWRDEWCYLFIYFYPCI